MPFSFYRSKRQSQAAVTDVRCTGCCTGVGNCGRGWLVRRWTHKRAPISFQTEPSIFFRLHIFLQNYIMGSSVLIRRPPLVSNANYRCVLPSDEILICSLRPPKPHPHCAALRPRHFSRSLATTPHSEIRVNNVWRTKLLSSTLETRTLLPLGCRSL